MLEQLINSADNCGQVGYFKAAAVATAYGVADPFLKVYGLPAEWQESNIDVGEFLAWLNANA